MFAGDVVLCVTCIKVEKHVIFRENIAIYEKQGSLHRAMEDTCGNSCYIHSSPIVVSSANGHYHQMIQDLRLKETAF